MPQSLDAHGQGRTLLRKYLWRSFLTDRYDRAANTAALQDHRGLKARLVDGKATVPIPVLDEALFPIAEVEELERLPGQIFVTPLPVEYWPSPSGVVVQILLMARQPTGSHCQDVNIIICFRPLCSRMRGVWMNPISIWH